MEFILFNIYKIYYFFIVITRCTFLTLLQLLLDYEATLSTYSYNIYKLYIAIIKILFTKNLSLFCTIYNSLLFILILLIIIFFSFFFLQKDSLTADTQVYYLRTVITGRTPNASSPTLRLPER